jgi:hypothetical protein
LQFPPWPQMSRTSEEYRELEGFAGTCKESDGIR